MSRPNIIFIVADDLGWADLGCYGARAAPFGAVSPQLDQLAAGGLRFTEGYANSPVCSPTRFALMSMRYQYRLRGALEEPINSRSAGDPRLGLPPEVPTLPSRLRHAGYATALIGKWHLGYPPAFGPLRSGYDQFYGIMAGGVDYFTHASSRGDHDLFEGETPARDSGYLTDLLSQRAVDYVRAQAAEARGQASQAHAQPSQARAQTPQARTQPSEARTARPFFLSLHYTAPHWPWETRDDEAISRGLGNLFHLHGGNVETYLRMIHHMDEGIGWLMQALRDEGLADDTIVVFTSDNGGERFSDNWPLVGGKMDLTEGGIRVPWIVHWPRGVPAGSTSPQHLMTMDMSATLLDAGGATPAASFPIDGVSMLAVLRDPATRVDRDMHWRMNHRQQRALRQGRWKYLKVDEHEYLFDIASDARERANLARREPERFARMRDAWLAWNETMPPIPDDATVSLGYSSADMPSR